MLKLLCGSYYKERYWLPSSHERPFRFAATIVDSVILSFVFVARFYIKVTMLIIGTLVKKSSG
jgi:hypothetical protein